jgi:superfamily II DNA/RNA helicase
MLDMGFADAIKKIIETITKHQDKDKHFQRILLSATPTTGFLKTKFKKNLFYFQFSVALNDFVDISLNKNPLRIDLSEEFNDQSVITVPKTLQQMFMIVPSKLRFVTLIAFLLKIFNTKVSSLNTLRNSSCFLFE